MTILVNQICNALQGLKLRKNRVLILAAPVSRERATLVEQLATASDVLVLDAVSAVTQKEAFAPGAFNSQDLADCIIELSDEHGQIICLDDIDPLVATLGEIGAHSFFQLARNITPRYPVILVTALGKLAEAAGFDRDRLYLL